MMNMGYFNGIYFLILRPGTSFVEVAESERLGGLRAEEGKEVG